MKSERCSVAFPPSPDRLGELSRSIWAASRPRHVKEKATDLARIILELRGGEFQKIPHLVESISQLPLKLRPVLIDLVLDFVGFLVAVDRAHPAAQHLAFRHEGEGLVLDVHCLEACLSCADGVAAFPKAHPEFCSGECAMEWVQRNARRVRRMDMMDDLLEEAKAQGEEEGQKIKGEELREAREAALEGENPLLDLLRAMTDNPCLSLEDAAWRLDLAIRRGTVRV